MSKLADETTSQKLYSHLFEACNILRGPINQDEYKSYVTPLLFFKRISDVYDEETQEALETSDGDEEFASFSENHRFIIPENCHWNDVRENTQNIGAAIINAMTSIERANPDTLSGVFSSFDDANWADKNKLSDERLKDLVEHMSKIKVGNKDYSDDVMGDSYEYLIKKFADLSKKNAGEFYTPRSIVKLLIKFLDPKDGDTVYDGAMGTGGMLIEAIRHMKTMQSSYGKIYGQEKNLATSAIGRMNLFLHGARDFKVIQGDTLRAPGFLYRGSLKTFNCVIANPPYSIKQWDRAAFEADKWGRNILGTPPQGRADYAFFQHIIKSMDEKNGRCAILFPHGVLFRQEEKDLREKLVKMDILDCVIGLAPNLFYNSPMEACIVICRMRKEPQKAGKVLFINAINEVTRKNAQSFLEESHINKIASAYENYQDIDGFAKVATIKDIADNNYSLSIPLYARETSNSAVAAETSFVEMCDLWKKTSEEMRLDYQELENMLGAEA